jgi:hypothetical protein
MKKHLVFLFVVALGIGGCAITKEWAATGGSRSDGVVKLSYEYGLFQAPQVSAQQGLELAKARCSAWGYSGAEAFGGVTRVCNNRDSTGCNSWLVTAEYQCTGRPEK